MSAVAARLGVHVSQRTFRVLLDTLSRPGSIGRLPAPPDTVPAALLPALALSDVEVSVRVLATDTADWEELIAIATGAPRAATPAAADIVTSLRAVSADEVLLARRGTALRPEDGARLVLAVARLEEVSSDHASPAGTTLLDLTGPGVPGTRRLAVHGLTTEVADAIVASRSGYPAGIDVHFVTAEGHTAAIPRSTRVSVVRLAEVAGGDR